MAAPQTAHDGTTQFVAAHDGTAHSSSTARSSTGHGSTARTAHSGMARSGTGHDGTASTAHGSTAGTATAPADATPPGTPKVRTQRVRRNRTGARLVALGVLAALIVVVAVAAPALVPYDPYAQDLSVALQPPSAAHVAGTDRYGRDLLSRIIMGARPSVFWTLALVCAICAMGTAVGLVCGWKGGRLDVVLMRTSDLFLAFPGLVFALAIAGVLGGGMAGAVLALAAIGWPKYARIARGLTLAQRSEQYLDAARLSGCTTGQLVFGHILPNIAGPVLVTAMLDIGTMMMELAGLSFLGLGAQPPVAEWGSMMSDARSLLQTAPWTVVAPGVAIFLTVMVFNLLGDTIRDWMDPNGQSGRGRLEGSPPGKAPAQDLGQQGQPRDKGQMG